MNSVLSLFTLPLIVNFSLNAFMGEDRTVTLEASKVLSVFAIVLIPVSIGMLIRARKEAVAKRLDGGSTSRSEPGVLSDESWTGLEPVSFTRST